MPELPATHVRRPELTGRLDDSVRDFAITFVAGFAGSGKTVMLAEWARSRPAGQVAWVSCDVTDADPIQFWTALVTALGTFDPTIGRDALDLIDADADLGHDAIASLVNDLFDRPGEHVLIIDDLQFAARPALDSLAALLDRLPSQVRVVLSARSDPRLPLHRWRAAGRLGEVRAADLEMTPVEVGELLRNAGVEVAPIDAAVLAQRTEGWAAGVQLAVLSMRHEADPAEFIRAFAGTDRNVADYLVGEVLRRQPDETVAFLLDTSVLDELFAPLCNAITGRTASADILERLERESLFVIPLDNEQTLYRYHHLFAELLRRLLAARHPERALRLQRAAAIWYADHDDPRRAVRHAILAEDPALVTGLIRGRVYAGFFTGSSEMVRGWINDLNRSHLTMPPELMIEYALALGLVGALVDARDWLARVDVVLPAATPAPLRARLAFTRGLTLGALGDARPAIAAAEYARSLVEPGDDEMVETGADHLLLRVYLYEDDLEAAGAVRDRVRARPHAPGQLDQLLFDGSISQLELEAGDLAAARATAEASAAAIEKLEAEHHFGASDALRTLAALAYEHDRLAEAEGLLERCVAIAGTGRPTFLLLARIELARVWAARGDLETAGAELDHAREALPPDVDSLLVQRVDALRVRLTLERGDVAGARAIAARLPDGRRRKIADVRCALAEHKIDDARRVLGELRASSPRRALERAMLDAEVARAAGDADVDEKLAAVLQLGRSTGFMRTVADEGPELATALADVLRRQPSDDYAEAFAPILERAIAASPARNVTLLGGVTLSERELTVLQYLATRLTTREIAAELYVSMNTFRTHTKSIYRKLAVDSRAAAVAGARTYGIL